MSTGHAIARPRAQRDPLERWDTPPHVAQAHVAWSVEQLAALGHDVAPHLMYDPWAGAGAYLDAGDFRGLKVDGSDVAPRDDRVARMSIEHLLAESLTCFRAWFCANPPFSRLAAHMPLLLATGAPLSLHLPISALERTRRGNGRAWLWDEYPPARIAHIGRVRHGGPAAEMAAGKGGAAMCYCWVLWVPNHDGPTVYEWLDLQAADRSPVVESVSAREPRQEGGAQ